MDDCLDWEPCAAGPGSEQSISAQGPPTAPAQVIPTEHGVSVATSTIFHPCSKLVSATPDCVLSSSDNVFFHLNSRTLQHAGSVATVPESSMILEVIFSAAYEIPCDTFAPLLDDILGAIDRMPPNGMDPKALIRKGTPLYGLIMRCHASYYPLRVYCAAAHYDIESLAQETSPYLLDLDIVEIDNASALLMGPLYLKRLVILIVGRVTALKRIVFDAPAHHPMVAGCSEEIQQAAKREWTYTISQIARDVKSSISPNSLKERCCLAVQSLPCDACQRSWYTHADDIAIQWAMVKSTI
ncbi:hypothetical protein BKA70DRAFT_776980 [Coprinopsis sp. MPI-PUGE-AT-0042]|nr:hypothetical protein BKA70DRAFT_776980 [Coprinopsis sp. MPI-PUGE-AT-0042]